jgi:FG-GAP-like repeat
MRSRDVNDDGKADLIWQNDAGTPAIWLMNGPTPIAEAGNGNPGSNWKVVAMADFNADSRDDIVLQNIVNGDLMVDLMKGTTITSTKTISVGAPFWHAASTDEFNEQAEIAWQNNNGASGIWLINGTTPVAEAGLQNPGPRWETHLGRPLHPERAGRPFIPERQRRAATLGDERTNVAAMVNSAPIRGAGWQSENGHPSCGLDRKIARAFNAPDPGSGSLHSSAPDGTVVGGPGAPSNLLHMTARG